MKRSVATLLFAFAALMACAQDFDPQPGPPHDKKKDSFWSADRIVYGGDLGLNFGTVTFVNLSPTIGYKITDKYVAGLGPVYIYFKDNQYNYSFNIYGGCVYNRYYLLDFLFAHAEYQPLNGPFDFFHEDRRIWINNVWVGGGLRQSLGNSSFSIMCLFNINETPFSYPRSPWIRGGISFGI